MPDDPNAPPVDPNAPPAAPPPAAWHAGLDADTLAYVQSKKLDGLTDWKEAFSNVAKFHRDAEAYIGIPADQRVRTPNPNDPASQREFWAKFGVPEAADKYDLSAVKFSDGSDLDPAFVSTVQQAAFKHNVPAEAATAFAKEFTTFLEAQDAAEETATKTALATQRDALQKEWGAAYLSNLAVADRAAKALGVDVDTAALLSEKVGADKVLQMFFKIGRATSEDTFHGAPPANNGVAPPLPVTEAKERLAALQGDKEFGAKLISGDVIAKREWDAVFAAAHPELVAAAAA